MKGTTCDWGYGPCTAPRGKCPHWQGTFCELDIEDPKEEVKTMSKEEKYEQLLYDYVEACIEYNRTEELGPWRKCYELKHKIINIMLGLTNNERKD